MSIEKGSSSSSSSSNFNVPLDPSHPMFKSSDINLKDVEMQRSGTFFFFFRNVKSRDVTFFFLTLFR
jgi:hypothetical protein